MTTHSHIVIEIPDGLDDDLDELLDTVHYDDESEPLLPDPDDPDDEPVTLAKHKGPGPHASGSPQTVHGNGGGSSPDADEFAHPIDDKFVDYQEDRKLTGPGTDLITKVIPSAKFTRYSQMPFLNEMHKRMGLKGNVLNYTLDEYITARNSFFRSLPVVTVPLDNLVVTQKRVNFAEMANMGKKHKGPAPPTYMVRYQGQTYIINGHHRTVRSVMEGKTSAKALVLDLDAVDVPVAKHKPGGVDHDQKTHGKLGPGEVAGTDPTLASDTGLVPSSDFDGPTVFRGINLKLEKADIDELRRLTAGATTEAEYNQHFLAGQLIADRIENYAGHPGLDEGGIGRNFTTDPAFAEVAGIAGGKGGVPVVVTVRTRKQDHQTDPTMLYDTNSLEDEHRLVPNAPVEIVDIKVQLGQRYESVWDVNGEGVGIEAYNRAYGA